MRSLFRILLLLSLLATIVGGLVWSFWPQPVPVECGTVGRDALRVTVDEDGKTRIRERYFVSSPLAGRLQRIELDPGDPVLCGRTLLATIEPNLPEVLDARELAMAQAKVKTAEAALRERAEPAMKRAEAELKFAASEWKRTQALAEKNAISQDQLEEAEVLYLTREQTYRSAELAENIARFELEMAQAALLWAQPAASPPPEEHRFPIYAPITGQVLRVSQESATVIHAGAALLELGDPKDLEIEVDVLSHDAVKICPGDKAFLEQWGEEQPLAARVRLVEPSGFTKISALGVEEQRVNVILDLTDPLASRPTLGDGFRVEARIVIWEQDDVLQIPTGALFRYQNQWASFVVDNGRAQLRQVEVGHRNSLAAEVLGGLREGDQVILHPSDKILDGVRVRPRSLSDG